MNEQVKDNIDKYPSEIIDMYNNLRKIIFDSVSENPEETLWAKIPRYYVGESFVRLIPFKDHTVEDFISETSDLSELCEKEPGYSLFTKDLRNDNNFIVNSALPNSSGCNVLS